MKNSLLPLFMLLFSSTVTHSFDNPAREQKRKIALQTKYNDHVNHRSEPITTSQPIPIRRTQAYSEELSNVSELSSQLSPDSVVSTASSSGSAKNSFFMNVMRGRTKRNSN